MDVFTSIRLSWRQPTLSGITSNWDECVQPEFA